MKRADICHPRAGGEPSLKTHCATSEMDSRLRGKDIINFQSDLLNAAYGKIYHYNAGEYPVSSSSLRDKITNGEDVSASIPKAVYDNIIKAGLYQNQ